jgi:hypothetical protein
VDASIGGQDTRARTSPHGGRNADARPPARRGTIRGPGAARHAPKDPPG